jgi:hypothetical protein
MVTKPRTPTKVSIVRSDETQLRCRSYGAGRDFITAIAIKIWLLRSRKPRSADGKPETTNHKS